MNGERRAFTGCEIFDGGRRHADAALLVEGGRVAGVLRDADIPGGFRKIRLDGGLIAPGFVDLQVNGGGGVMLNDEQSVEALDRICRAHRQFGTTSLLATLITDTKDTTAAAVRAVTDAIAQRIDGVVGLHLEGPHLSLARKGAHDPALIRPMDDGDFALVSGAAGAMPSLMITVAPETVAPDRIADLAAAGAVVSLGHSDAGFDAARQAAASGASCVTHLFNAMSQLGNREPGLVGAALATGGLSAGLIADGFHVDPATIGIALRAKTDPGKIFLVTDAMSTIGTDAAGLCLNGRRIRREGGRLTLEDGTLAGADLDMISAVRFMVERIGVPVDEALRMASLYPARVLKRENEIGRLAPGARADFLRLDTELRLLNVWCGGVEFPVSGQPAAIV
ncbi:MAG: N-acetylglucosamine-6-phosphate deacetylase [Paracoccaceae bacterium]